MFGRTDRLNIKMAIAEVWVYEKGGNAFSLKMEYSIKTTGRIILPAMQRTVVHANFHWKLVQRYELFLKDARILEEKSSYLRYFRPFLSLFSFYLVLLQW